MEATNAMDDEEETFFHPYMAPTRMENSIIDFDLQNLQKLLVENKSNYPAEKIAERVRDHYLDSSRLIKRAYGRKIEDDFQLYNWGLTLTMDMGLATDKLELLLNMYAKKLPRRVTLPDFERFMKEHSTWRHIKDRYSRRAKWMDLMASFAIHTVRREGFPDTIGKRQFQTILDVNELDMDLDLVKLTRDIRQADKYSNKLHMLLMDDPLISGNFSAELAQEMEESEENPHENERFRDFQSRIRDEEEEFGALEQKEVDARLRKQFEEKEALEEKRRVARKLKEENRIAVRKAEEEEKRARIARLEEIRIEREEYEKKKEDAAKRAEEEARLEKMRKEREDIIKQEEQYAASELRAVTDQARRDEEERQRLEAAVPGKYDHLSGIERIKAEAADRLAEHKRQKGLERRRLLEETRKYAESQLALRTSRDLGSRFSKTGGAVDGTFDSRTSSAGDGGKKRKLRNTMSGVDIKETSKDKTTSEDAMSILKKSGNRSATAAAAKRRTKSPERPSTGTLELSADDLVEKERQLEETRNAAAEAEFIRVEQSRAKFRRDEEERIRTIELAAIQKEQKMLDNLQRKQTEEDARRLKLEEQAKLRADREAEIAETRALRKIADAELATAAISKKSNNKADRELRKERLRMEEATVAKKAKIDRDSRREQAKFRAEEMQRDKVGKKTLMANVLKKSASAPKPKAKKTLARSADVLEYTDVLDDAEIEAEPLVGEAMDVDVSAMPVESESIVKAPTDHIISENINDDMETSHFEEETEKSSMEVLLPEKESESESNMLSVDDLDKMFPVPTEVTPAEIGDGVQEGSGLQERDIPNEESDDVAICAITDEPDFTATKEIQEEVPSRASNEDYLFSENDDLQVPTSDVRLESDMLGLAYIEEAATETFATHVVGSSAVELADGGRADNKRLELQENLKADALDPQLSESRESSQREDREHKEEDQVFVSEASPTDIMAQDGTKDKGLEAEAEDMLQPSVAEAADEKKRQEEEIKEKEKDAVLAAVEAQNSRVLLEEEEAAAAAEARKIVADKIAEDMARTEEAARIRSQEEERALAESEAQKHAELNAQLRSAEIQRASEVEEQLERERVERELREQEEDDRRLERERENQEEVGRKEAKARLEQAAAGVERLEQEAVEERLRLEAEVLAKEAEDKRIAEEDAAAEVQKKKEADEEDDFWAEQVEDTASRRSSKPSIVSLPAFQIHEEHEKFVRPQHALNMDEIRGLPSYEVEIKVTKSYDGTLRINLREDQDGDHRGLFVHSFKASSVAEQEGELQVHDEVLRVDGVDVEGKELSVVVGVLQKHESLVVDLCVRRHHVDMGKILYDGMVPDRSIVNDNDTLSAEHLQELGLPSLRDLHELPAEVVEVEVPKSEDGDLRLAFRRAVEDGHAAGALVLHEFLPDCAAVPLDTLKVGDELLAINGFDMRDGGNHAMNEILALPVSLAKPTVTMRLRRHNVDLAKYVRDRGASPELKEEMLKSVPAFSILDGLVSRHPDIPTLDELRYGDIPFEEFDVVVPKSTDGTLRINLRHDDEGDVHGLFVHGFKPNSRAEQQSIVRVGDEVLSMHGVDVEGQFLSSIVGILRSHEGSSVPMRLRRHIVSSPNPNLQLDFSDTGIANGGVGGGSPRPQIKSARLEMSPRAQQIKSARSGASPSPRAAVHDAPATPVLTARSEHELYQIHDSPTKDGKGATMAELSLFPAVDIELLVPKSKDGSLRLYIRHDDEGDAHGLFIHGFKQNCAAERQGLLKIGDEILEINRSNVKGLFLEDIVLALAGHADGSVHMLIRRHLMEEHDQLLDEMVQHEFAANRAELQLQVSLRLNLFLRYFSLYCWYLVKCGVLH